MSLCVGIITCSGILEFLLVTGGALIGGVRVLLGRERVLLKAILLSATALLAYPVSLFLLVILMNLVAPLTPVLNLFTGVILAGFLMALAWFGLGMGLRSVALTNDSTIPRFFSGLALGTGIAWFLVTVFGLVTLV